MHKSRCDNYDLSRTLLVYSVTPPYAPPMNLKRNHIFWMKKMASFINFDEKRIRFSINFNLTKLLNKSSLWMECFWHFSSKLRQLYVPINDHFCCFYCCSSPFFSCLLFRPARCLRPFPSNCSDGD